MNYYVFKFGLIIIIMNTLRLRMYSSNKYSRSKTKVAVKPELNREREVKYDSKTKTLLESVL